MHKFIWQTMFFWVVLFGCMEAVAQIRPENMDMAVIKQHNMNKKFFPEMKQERIDWAKKLKMTEAQKAQLDEIYAQSREQTEGIMLQIDELHKQLVAVREADEAKIRQILDAKQLKKFDQTIERIKKHNQPPKPRPEKRKRPTLSENVANDLRRLQNQN